MRPDDYPDVFRALFRLSNLRGALVTMPHKVATVELVDELTPTARIAGACNAVLRRADGTLLGDQFDGAGFVRGLRRKGARLAGARAIISGCGGVGSAIAASLAAEGVTELALSDTRPAVAEALGLRLTEHYRAWPCAPAAAIRTASTSSSTPLRSACAPTIRCPSTSRASHRRRSSARS